MKPDARNLSVNMRGDDVKLLQKRLTELGFSIEDKDGFFGKATRRAVMDIQKKHGMKATGIVDEVTDEVIMNNAGVDMTIDLNVPVKKEPVLSDFIVRGNVHNNDGTPRPGLIVNAFDHNIRMEDTFLGQNVTDEKGNYSISYTLDQLSGKDSADLVVGVYQNDKLLQDPVVIINAEPVKEIDFIFTIEEVPEFQQTTTKILPLLRNRIKLAGLEKKDIDYLNKRTGIETPKIERLAQSHRLSGGDETLSVFYYGLLSQDLPTDPAALLSRDRASIDRALSRAESLRVIPALNPQDVERILDEELPMLWAARTLEPSPEGKPSSLGDLLGTVPHTEALSREEQLTIARLRNEHGNTDEFWNRATEAISSRSLSALKRTKALDELTSGHTSVIKALHAKYDIEHPESIEFLTTLEPTDWIKLVFEHGVPPGSGFDRDGYIEQLQANVEEKFPMKMLSKHLERKLGESESFPTRKVLDFLKNNPAFDLRKQHVEPYLNEIDKADDLLREGLLRVQRLDALTDNPRETVVLLDAGLNSASQMVRAGKPAFDLKVGNQLLPERAEEIFAAAKNVVTTLAVIGTTYFSPFTSRNYTSVVLKPSASQEMQNKYPSLRSLFGDLDYCECRHCRSVLGPAAYLADLLHFLQDSKLIPNNEEGNPILEWAMGGSVLGVLLQRRPDLADLELSCENTDTKIPYIDLVLEILENAVALPMKLIIEGKNPINFLNHGEVPSTVVEALKKTNIEVGKDLFVTPNLYMNDNSPFSNWIITDGSRRWLVQHGENQLVYMLYGPPEVSSLSKVLDVEGAIDSLQNGRLNTELEEKLALKLSIEGAPNAPQIQDISIGWIQANAILGAFRGWTVNYTRSIAIRCVFTHPTATVELFKLDGTQFDPPRQFQSDWQTVTNINGSFESDAISNINSNVAQLLKLPENETYEQIWNSTKNWWELRIKTRAMFVQYEKGLNVSGLTYQNSSIRDHLESSPENRNPAAYEKIKDAVFPWALPFDLWLEETRAFLEELGIPRSHLFDLARPQSRLSEEAASFELLGLSKSEAVLLTSRAASSETWKYWGIEELNNKILDQSSGENRTGTWLEVLKYVSILLQQSGLSYREYLDLLQTGFVKFDDLLLYPPNECKISNILIIEQDKNKKINFPIFLTSHLISVHDFTRLWRKSGWSMQELDLALAAFGGRITSTTPQDLALLKRLSAKLGLSVRVLVGCIDKLDTKTWTDHTKDGTPIEPSLYNSVFQRQSLRSITGFDDLAFDKLENPLEKISYRADFIAASLGIKPAQVLAWINGFGIVDWDFIKLDNLSRLYAAASLCRALKIAPDTLPDIVTLLGEKANPFLTKPAPTPIEQVRARAYSMLEFVERICFVRESGFDFETLGNLLQHKRFVSSPSDASARVDQQISQTLTELRAALQSGVVLGDVSADNVKRQLARLGWYPALIDAAMGSDGLNYQFSVSIKINPLSLKQEPEIPLDLRSRFTYRKIDENLAMLECSGPLKDTDFKIIENIFPKLTALKTKYKDELYARTNALARLMQIIELEEIPILKENVTGLTALPIIPGELKDRLKFEMTKDSDGILTLTGWLTDAERNTFNSANSASFSLTMAVSNLQMEALKKIPAMPAQTLKDAEKLLDQLDVETRYRSILVRMASHLELDLLVTQLSVALGCDSQVVRKLLDAAKVNDRSAIALFMDSEFLGSDSRSALGRNTWGDQFAVVELLGKIATIVNRLTIKSDQLEWILNGPFGVMNVLALPTNDHAVPATFEGWRRLLDLFHLRDVLPDGSDRLARIIAELERADFTVSTVHKEFADAFELSQKEVEDACFVELLDLKESAQGEDFHNPGNLLALAQLLYVIKSLGTTAEDVRRLIQPNPDESVAQLARNLFAASINSEEFPERLRPISNRLRNLQRNALVAHLVQRDHLADSNELFDRYLIDVDMGSCMFTSRIKQAISSVQLFVQRCLLNLERPANPGEPGVRPESIDAQRWQWMKYYRVWEANRKVFLYPENWIEPELRDDKSEIFQAFESDLLQSEITHDSALVAFRNYLDKMADITNLTIVSMFEETLPLNSDGSSNGSIVYLVGRDNSKPYKHYYRQWKPPETEDTFGTWTAWEEISAQLDSEHVMVFLFGGSVYLAWPTISSGQGENLKWKIGMNLAKRSASGWTKLKKGREEIEIPMVPYKDEITSLAFRIKYNSDKTVSIETYGPPDQEPGEEPKETKREVVSEFFDPEVEKYGDEILESSDPASIHNPPYIYLNMRILESYVYEYAGKVKHTYYKQKKDAQDIKITVSYSWIVPRDDTVGNGWHNPVPEKPTYTYSSVEEDCLLRDFLGLIDYQWRFYDALDKSKWHYTHRILASDVEFTVKVKNITRKLSLTKGNSLTWQEDFIFPLKDDPGWLTKGDFNLVKHGSYKLKDDDSLELKIEDLATTKLDILNSTESFMSGYREVGKSGLTILPSSQKLDDIPPPYFIVSAISELDPNKPSPLSIYAYRDDRFSLLFWNRPPSDLYRVVPFSTGGIGKLKSYVTKGRLLDAINLPDKLIPTLIPVFVYDSNGFRSVDNSMTDVKIAFDKVPTSIYNWEVFFHNPLLVATQLSRAQRFEEAQRWFHLIFDPTTDDPGTEPTRYWRFLPFRDNGKGNAIDDLLEELARTTLKQGLNPTMKGLKDQIKEWALNPFRPHLIARVRWRSYQFAVVLKYLENLIAWGDQLFRRDTIESINEATQLYVLAFRILGKRPVSSPRRVSNPKSYRDIFFGMDDLSNRWITLEALIAAAFERSSKKIGSEDILKFGTLYFCVLGNEKLSDYWNTVEDRLFKIRHCMNMEGMERQLPLFEPPIDPALLVRATAAGLDLSAVLNDMQAPLPLYRFNVMVQKAQELCNEVRGLGNALLSALEKKDAEGLSLMRSNHEVLMLQAVKGIKEQQLKEAQTNLEALNKTRDITVARFINYQRLMGKQNVAAPEKGDAATLESPTLQLAPPGAGGDDTQDLALISAESDQLDWLNEGNNFSITAGIFNTLGGVTHALPNNTIGAIFNSTTWGGSNLGQAFNSVGSLFSTLASNAGFQANKSSIIGGHQRRLDEWRFQSNTAAREIQQIDKQILANEIRIQIATDEITNHDKQIEDSKEVDEFMHDKFTNQQLYSWMVGQISSVYFSTYQMAYDIARRAERTYSFELGLKDSKDTSFIEFGYWDSLKKGLMSGERLSFDLKRMEVAYLNQNKREYEITKNVSLMQLNPLALLELKQTGQCEMTIPEGLFDMDYPGHYMRRIKSVTITIPCITGPYTSVNCTLTLQKSILRHTSKLSGGMYQSQEDDPRFTYYFNSIQSIVTSSGQNDSGMFETNLRDERYLPFEGSGVISTWRLELPKDIRQFDYNTISDVILHLRYTARDGGEQLKKGASDNLKTMIDEAQAAGSVRLFSVRHEFPTDWARFKGKIEGGISELTLNLQPEYYPFWSKGKDNKPIVLEQMDFFAKPTKDTTKETITVFDKPKDDGTRKEFKLEKKSTLNDIRMGKLKNITLPPATGKFTLYLDDNSMEDLWLAMTWGK